MRRAEIVQRLPSCFGRVHALPVDQNVTYATAKVGAEHAFRLRKEPTVLQGRKRRSRCRQCSPERLQDSDKEDVVDACVDRELKAVGDGAHSFQDLEWSSEAWAELGAGAWNERLSVAVQEAQPHPLSDYELHGTVVRVVVAASILLGL
jgi:hypothetical protein